MLEKILRKFAFQRTLATGALLLGLAGCGEDGVGKNYPKTNISGRDVVSDVYDVVDVVPQDPEQQDEIRSRDNYAETGAVSYFDVDSQDSKQQEEISRQEGISSPDNYNEETANPPCEKKTFFWDNDGDGYGVKEISEQSCKAPSGYVSNLGDCDDNNPNRNPAIEDICNSIDDNCDGQTDEGVTFNDWYKDHDGDGFPTSSESVKACMPPEGYRAHNPLDPWDCNDSEIDVSPVAIEVCNGLDDNCNGQMDEGLPLSAWYKDNDQDSFGDQDTKEFFCNIPPGEYVNNPQDCNDSDPDINPNTTEVCDNVDNNCDGQVDESLILECYTGCGTGSQLCENGGWTACTAPLPEEEVCDGIDNDCNGLIDENLLKICSTACGEGIEGCVNEQWKECTAPKPEPEVCDHVDNNCDGAVDEGLNGVTWFKDGDNDGYGASEKIILDCQKPEGYVDNNLDLFDDNPKVCGSILWRSEAVTCSAAQFPFIALGKDGIIYVNDDAGYLFAINPKDGTLEGQSDTVAIDPVISGDGIIYARHGTTMKALEEIVLEEKWDYHFSVCGSDVFSDADLTSDSGVFNISLSPNGIAYASVRLKSINVAPYKSCGHIEAVTKSGEGQWAYDIGPFETGTSVGPDETIYAGRYAKLYALDPTGTLKWEQDFSNLYAGYIKSPPLFGPKGELFFFTTTSQDLVAYSGGSIWMIQKWGQGLPVIDVKGDLYSKQGAISSAGFVHWETDQYSFSQAVIASNDVLYLFGSGGLEIADAEKGDTMMYLTTDPVGPNWISPNNLVLGDNGTLYFCNAVNGVLYSVCGTQPLDKEAPWPTARHDNQRTGNFNKK
ncbi:PQQ-binding-like beta-propeller repeat protein [Candidatus Woesearchaeota archaeon]|nr:PQQ-binding-like beta-propeller repeat protein [Candidatus Woesearchaeota archaeon]